MINCPSCSFEVSNKMRHALVKNMCPACGSPLLGDFHMQRLSMVKEKLLSQEFSRNIDPSTVFDISLFIMSEFFPSNPNRSMSSKLVEPEDSESEDDNLEKIREQVRRDAMKASMDDDLDQDADSFDDDPALEQDELFEAVRTQNPKSEQDLKIAKLKRLYNESPTLRKGGVSVRRVT